MPLPRLHHCHSSLFNDIPFSQQLGDVWCARMHQTLINVLGTALACVNGVAQEA